MTDDRCCPACGRDYPDTNTAGPNVAGSDTSRAAAFHVAPKAGTYRRRVLEELLTRYDHGLSGCTDEDGAATLRMDGNTYRPRRVELTKGMWVEDTGRRHLTASREAAVVWGPTAAAIQWARQEGMGTDGGALRAPQPTLSLF